MKQLTIIISLITGLQLNAQLQITSGAEIKMTGAAILTLQDISLINEGTFNQTEGTVRFTGNTNTDIGGSQNIRFNIIEVTKGTNNRLLLQQAINADNQISFITGYLDLNGFTISLAPTALLINEMESSRITGTNGGYIEITNTLNAPSSANPGNLGAIFTSAANMGSTVIRRGHLSQVNGAGAGNSIHRYYDITPTTNTGLNASLRFQYFDAELNGLAENALMMWKSINNTSWTNEGFTTRDGTINYVEKTSIPGFSRWTLSSPGNPLPVVFSLFNVKCDNNKVEINWKTASEQNSDRFEVQHSGNGSLWTTIGTLPAAGNSTIEKSYSFIDNSPLASASFYRIAQFDIDGKIQYTGIIKNDCNHTGNIKLWPNPVVSQLYISITTTARSNTSINLYDAKGTLIRTQQTALITGNNLVNIDMSSLPNGIYHVAASWNQGSSQQSFKIIKQ